jgi:hypothetical protein
MIPMTSAKAIRASASVVSVIGLALGIMACLGGATSKSVVTAHIASAPTARGIFRAPAGMVDGTRTSTAGAASAIVASTPSAIVAAAPAVPKPVAPPPVATPSVATLVAEVEADGMEPGANWTWTMGDTAAHCGVITGAGTGCTFGAAGLEYSIFAGSPTLALVAHELANAETQNDAVPSLLNEVAVAANGTSWSPTDAVASCLVEHFLGFQDDAAGTWQCPTTLATVVADNIHDSI